MNIILLAAGESSRFPNKKPKYLLPCNGELMVEKAISCFPNYMPITVVVLKKHCEQYGSDVALKNLFGDRISIIVLDALTNGPAESAMLGIERANISGPVFIKDCDSFFYFSETIDSTKNGVSAVRLQDYPYLNNIGNKSFIKTNDQDIIHSIIEKKIVSDILSVGGYQFKDADRFVKETKELLKSVTKELYISNVIDSLIIHGEVFETIFVEKYVDVGTLEEWEKL